MKTLSDIVNAIKDKLLSDEAQAAISTTTAVIAATGPTGTIVATAGTALNDLLKVSDDISMRNLFRELNTGLNQEMAINQLYNYVNTSQRRAYWVKDAMLKARASSSPLVQLLLGVILSDHVKEPSDYTEDDLVITQALDNATDWDIKNFYEELGKYINTGDSFNPIPEEIKKYDFMFQWANNNRILNRISGTSPDFHVPGEQDETQNTFTLILEGVYEINACTKKLYGYCERIKQKLVDSFEE